MKPNNPQQNNLNTPQGILTWAVSVFKTLVGGIAFAAPQGQDSSNTWNTFVQDNGYGVMVRVGANGDSSNALTWDSTGACVIPHGLQRQPIGFLVCDSSGECSVWRTATATTNTLSLKTSDNGVANTFWIF